MQKFLGLSMYLIGRNVYFVTRGITEYQFGMQVNPVFVADLDDIEGLISGFNSAIDAFQPSVKFIRHSPANDTPILRAAKLRSWAALHRVAKNVAVDFSNDSIEFEPLRNDGPRGGFASFGKKFQIDAQTGDIVSAIRKAFEIAT